MGATKRAAVAGNKGNKGAAVTPPAVTAEVAVPVAVAEVVTPPAAPVAVAVPAPVQVPGASPGNTWCGYTLCGLLRAMGYAGYTAKQGLQLCGTVGLATSPSTVTCQVGGGRQVAAAVAVPHHTGAITPLAGAVLGYVQAICGQPAKPHAVTAPLPPAHTPMVQAVPAVTVVPPTPVAPPVTVVPPAAPVAPPAAVTVTVPVAGVPTPVAVTAEVAAVLKGKGRKGK